MFIPARAACRSISLFDNIGFRRFQSSNAFLSKKMCLPFGLENGISWVDVRRYRWPVDMFRYLAASSTLNTSFRM